MTPEDFAQIQFGSLPRQPHSVIITEESLEQILCHLQHSAQEILRSQTVASKTQIKVAIVGSSASRWSWHLQSLNIVGEMITVVTISP